MRNIHLGPSRSYDNAGKPRTGVGMSADERDRGAQSEPDESTSRRGLLGRIPEGLLSPKRLGQFGAVGLLGMSVDTAILGLLFQGAGVPIWLAKLVGAEVSIVVMFFSNEWWTFGDAGRHPGGWGVLRRLLRSNVVRAGGIAVATVVLVAGYEFLGIWWPVANVIGIVCGFVFNYVLESLYTWRVAGPFSEVR